MKGFNYKKAVQALNFFALAEGGNINKMKALKLVWLSDRLHLRRYSRAITGDVYFALKNGPVASTTRNLLEDWELDNCNHVWGLEALERDYRNAFIEENENRYLFNSTNIISEKVFSKTDLEVLHEVYEKYGELNHFELSDLSHEFPEWKPYQTALERGEMTRAEINPMDFFKNYNDNRGLFNDTEEYLSISKEMYLSPVF
jgi:uncharacterized phage-associated protein